MYTKKKTPHGRGGHAGRQNLQTQRTYRTEFPPVGQVCVCSPCRYFRLIPLVKGGIRRVCIFTGEGLGIDGDPLCEFRTTEGEA